MALEGLENYCCRPTPPCEMGKPRSGEGRGLSLFIWKVGGRTGSLYFRKICLPLEWEGYGGRRPMQCLGQAVGGRVGGLAVALAGERVQS